MQPCEGYRTVIRTTTGEEFCKSATLEVIGIYNYVLMPCRYVSAAKAENDDVSFDERPAELRVTLVEQFGEAEELSTRIYKQLKVINPNV